MNGGSTGFAPIQVNKHTVEMNTQNHIFFVGENFLFNLLVFTVRIIKIKIAEIIATTPPSLDGIDRKIA